MGVNVVHKLVAKHLRICDVEPRPFGYDFCKISDDLYDYLFKITFDKLFGEYDAVIMPACSKNEYKDEDKYMAFEENLYTAPASITGLPAVVCGGVQIVGKAFSDSLILDIAEIAEKEGK